MIDLDMFGIAGVEPEFMKASRAKAMQDEEFGFWDKLLDGGWMWDSEWRQHA